MNTRGGWVGAAVLAAAFTMVAAPAVAQDGKRPAASEKQKAPKVDWAAQQRAAAKKAEAEKKRAAAEKAAEEAAQAEAEAAKAEEEAAPPVEEEAAEADEIAEAEETTEEQPETAAEGAVSPEDEEAAEKPELSRDKRQRRDRRRRPRRRPAYAPSPDRQTPPPYHFAGPYTMEYIDGSEVPDGYTKVERVRKGLVIAGAVTWGVSWLIAATAAASLDEEVQEDTAPLFAPIVGPFIAMATLEPEGAGRAALLVNGVAQVAGAAMLIGGVAATKTVLVRTGSTEINVRPGVGSLSFDGSF